MNKIFLLFCALLVWQLEDGVVTADETCDVEDVTNSLQDCLKKIKGYTKPPEYDTCTTLKYLYGTVISCFKNLKNTLSSSCDNVVDGSIEELIKVRDKYYKKYNCKN
ncbi:Uncharacterised protein g11151 [Pycnogonum litorale]